MNKVHSRKKIITVALLGNCLELYDLGLCGFLLPVITPLFFPTDNPFTSLLAGMSMFAVGFIMRPLGGFLFGFIGDKFGRRISLSNTMLLMALPTLIISLLPTYSMIAFFAPVIFLVCRMLQGLCVGGEYNNAAIYLLESSNPKRRGLYSSLLTASSNVGFALASVFSILILYLPFSPEWTWRVPFFIGAAIGIIGFQLRRDKTMESPAFEKPSEQNSPRPPLKKLKQGLIATFIIGWLAGALCLTLVGYFPSYLQLIGHLSKEDAILITNICLFSHMILLPVFGMLSDRIGPRNLMYLSTLLIFSGSYFIFYFLSSGIFYLALMAGLVFIILMSLFMAPMHAYTLELFPPYVRCRAISISFALGMGLLGGTTPMIATFFVKLFGFKEAPCIYFMLSAFAGIIALRVLTLKSELEPVQEYMQTNTRAVVGVLGQ